MILKLLLLTNQTTMAVFSPQASCIVEPEAAAGDPAMAQPLNTSGESVHQPVQVKKKLPVSLVQRQPPPICCVKNTLN